MKKQPIYFLFLMSMLLLTTCKKETTNPNGYIGKYFRNFFFKTGTYWVYENNVTHELDSQYVYRTSYQVNYSGNPYDNTEHYSEDYSCDIYSYFNGRIYSANIDMQGYGFGVSDFWYMDSSTMDGIILTNNASYSYYTGTIDNLVISDSTFSAVFKNKIPQFRSTNRWLYYDNEFWVCPRYGIIKRIEYGTPQGNVEWNLVRWKIIM